MTILQIGDSALHLAVKEGRVVNAALLIDNGADVNARSKVHTLIFLIFTLVMRYRINNNSNCMFALRS